MNGKVDEEFQRLVEPFLAAHPGVTCEWRSVRGLLDDSRRDLICAEGTPYEVFATIRPDGATVGTRESHDDFQDFGRRDGAADVARNAFNLFVELLRTNGHLDRAL
jgi:hypothetical protein